MGRPRVVKEEVLFMERLTPAEILRMFADVDDTGNDVGLEYQGISVGLHSDDRGLLDWFGAFFGGYFTVTTRGQTDAAVYSSKDPAVFERLKECATANGHPRADGEIEYPLDARHSIIHHRETDEAKGTVAEHCFILVEPGRRVFISSPGDLKGHQREVKRSLRNLMKLLLMDQGWLPFHASACVWNDTGICILGSKFAGKTSTQVNLLSRPGARLVTNDNLFLRSSGTGLEGLGFPNKAGLRIGALAAYPQLVDWIERATDAFYPQISAETFHRIVATTPAEELGNRSEKIVLLASELAEQFDIPIQPVAPIDLFLVVQYDPSLERSHLAPITDPGRLKDVMDATYRSLGKEKQDFLQRFFEFDEDRLQAAYEELRAKVLSRVAVYELRQNANTNEHSAELVGELTQQLHQRA
jgi:hypothetical protein